MMNAISWRFINGSKMKDDWDQLNIGQHSGQSNDDGFFQQKDRNDNLGKHWKYQKYIEYYFSNTDIRGTVNDNIMTITNTLIKQQ